MFIRRLHTYHDFPVCKFHRRIIYTFSILEVPLNVVLHESQAISTQITDHYILYYIIINNEKTKEIRKKLLNLITRRIN